MILEALIRLFLGLVTMLVDLIPDIDFNLDLSIASALNSVISVMDSFVMLAPVLASFAFTFVIDNIGFFVRIFNFIIRKIPGLS